MSNRKPYIREMRRTWWKDNPFYCMYMIREATVLPLIFFTAFLTFGVGSLAMGESAWQRWLNFMANPVVIAMDIVALLGSLYHAQTFFSMMPQVMPIRIKGQKFNNKIMVLAQWAVVVMISTVILLVV
ncbi:fumarate reductase subunit FrdC [Candidatus Enterovibrio altilux]|uniref:Fumarate reductase subunit C n=1 Tax=Candidatus Enterovibrio altilux TaxID=1927128 RepID=A0A291B9B5_9GAMM|nr:fumarate reductase subunit FrdC [Candidatus Enterovibrio luxaltus]ATF09573.1 Fumarate reductase subunit C [Candidatus Enterovibrio luxaltus]